MSHFQLIGRLYEAVKAGNEESLLELKLDAIVDGFAQHVGPLLAQTNLLFDEYTPHDVPLHISSLSRITDELLGDRIDCLNSVEASILACALYGHDWGMAVSEEEKAVIVTGKKINGETTHEFALVAKEREIWKTFSKQNGISTEDNGYVSLQTDVSKPVWRDYVRKTHAERSRVRCEQYFAGRLADYGTAVGEVCAGHWYYIDQIRGVDSKATVGGKIVNLQALAVYMRFIDLLDIGKNRTPYSLWKFVNPKDRISAIEWKKHQALSPVSFTKEDDSNRPRQIVVRGATDDHVVYANLQDLERYLREQIEENITVLEEHGNYYLGPTRLDWQVEPQEFIPINIRFEFDREQMFDLVSGEIYDGDPFVFIRELLQNSIDACSQRRTRYAADGGASPGHQVIRVTICTDVSGDSVVTIEDDGAGMTQRIVRDYLAKIGRSYYRSKEYGELGLKMTPISRFGVGLLSCFEVASSIAVRTCTDPKFGDVQPLDIQIEGRSQQFRVTEDAGNTHVGTTVKVFVEKERLALGEVGSVTDYIKHLIGFNQFPIVISENGDVTLIGSDTTLPGQMNSLRKQFPNAVLHEADLPSDTEIFHSQDLSSSTLAFERRVTKLSRTVSGTKLKGKILQYLPTQRVEFSLPYRGQTTGYTGTHIYQPSTTNRFVGARGRWLSTHGQNPTGAWPSINSVVGTDVFLQGVRLPDVEIKVGDQTSSPAPRVMLNIENSSDSISPVLSRRSTKTPLPDLNAIVQSEINKDVKREFGTRFDGAALMERLVLLGSLKTYYNACLEDCFDLGLWPIPCVSDSGNIEFRTLDDLPNEIETISHKTITDSAQFKFNGITTWPPEGWFQTFSLPPEIRPLNRPLCINTFGTASNSCPVEWPAMAACISLAIKSKYKNRGARLLQHPTHSHIFDIHRTGKTEIETAPLQGRLSKIRLTELESGDNYVAILPLERNGSLHSLCINTSHVAGSIMARAITAHQQLIGTDEKANERDQMDDIVNNYDLLQYYYESYTGNRFEVETPSWIVRYCRAAAALGLITLSTVEEGALGSKMQVIAAHQ